MDAAHSHVPAGIRTLESSSYRSGIATAARKLLVSIRAMGLSNCRIPTKLCVSNHARSVGRCRSSRAGPLAEEIHHGATTGCNCLFVGQCCCGCVLECSAGRIENGYLVARGTPARPTGDEITKLGFDIRNRQDAAVQRMMQLANVRALLRDVGEDAGACHHFRIQFLLVRTICAYCGHERARRDPRSLDYRLSAGSAGHHHVALLE